MADQVHITGFDAAALKALAAAINNASHTLPAGTPYNGRKTGMPGANNKDPIKATAKSMGKLGDETGDLEDSFNELGAALKKVKKQLGSLVTAGSAGTGAANGAAKAAKPAKIPKVKDSGVKDLSRDFEEAGDTVSKSSSLLSNKFQRIAMEGGGLGHALHSLSQLIEGPVIQIFSDVFKLQRRGIAAQGNLLDFYIAAGKAGMSLDEYIKLIEENTVAVARSKSFADFNHRLEATTEQLAGLGVFGAAARTMTATMMSSATTLGVPQAQLGNVVTDQIKTFKQLRDVTGMTAAGFQQLVSDFSKMEEAQGLLLGMAPDQREQARKDLFNSYTLGQQMGLTADASQRLGAALLAQRKMTAVDRFKAQGTIRQAGAIVGMGAGETEELAKLGLKKNRSKEENARFVELGGRMQAGLETMQNSGNLAAENIADQLGTAFPGGLGEQLRAAGEAKLTTDSGEVNKNFSASTGKFGQFVGQFGTWVEGLVKSPLYDIVKNLGGIVLGLAAFRVLGGGGITGAITEGLKGALGFGGKGGAKDTATAASATAGNLGAAAPAWTTTLGAAAQNMASSAAEIVKAPNWNTALGASSGAKTAGIPATAKISTAGLTTALGANGSGLVTAMSELTTSLGAAGPKLGDAAKTVQHQIPAWTTSLGAAEKTSTGLFSRLFESIGSVLKGGSASVTQAGTSSTGLFSRMFGSIGSVLRNGSVAVAQAGVSSGKYVGNSFINVAKGMKDGLTGLGSSLWNGAKSIATGGAAAAGSFGKMGLGLLKGLTGPFAAIFAGIEEMFTGEMAKALGLGDGIFGRILGVAIAGFNGIFTGISRLFDDVVNWLLEGLGIKFTVNTTKFFDMATSMIVDGWKMIGSGLMKALAWIIESVVGIFGLKAPFVEQLRAGAASIDKSVAESTANREKMWETEGSTLRKQGENLKEKEKIAATAAAVDKKANVSTSGVVMGLDSLVSSAQSTVQQAQAGMQTQAAQQAQPAMQAAPVIATPGQTDRAGVTQPDVNKPQVEEKKEKPVVSGGNAVDNMAAVLVVLQQQLEIAKQQLAAMSGKKDEPAIQLSRPPLPSTADLTSAVYA